MLVFHDTENCPPEPESENSQRRGRFSVLVPHDTENCPLDNGEGTKEKK